MTKDKFFYPATPETMHGYAASLFAPIRRGECVSTVWVPMAGRRMWNRFLVENISLFEYEFPEYKSYILVYVEPLDLTEETLPGYLRLIGKSFQSECEKREGCKEKVNPESNFKIFDDENATYGQLLETLKACIKRAIDGGFQVVLFLGEFDEQSFANILFYNNLKSLWEGLSPNLHYVFLSIADPSTPEVTSKLGELNAATLQNVQYIPIRLRKDIDYLVDFFSERQGGSLSKEERDLIEKLCGGHPYLIKAAVRIMVNGGGERPSLPEQRENLEKHFEILSVVKKIFDLRSPAEQLVLSKIAVGAEVEPSVDLARLIMLGLVVQENGGKRLFGDLFRAFAAGGEIALGGVQTTTKEVGELSLNSYGEVVGAGSVSIDERFTGQEYNVIKFLLSEPAKLRSRDEIGEALWGGESYEKYSDWAIDQVMSKIRKKLKSLGTRTQLVTIRGRGYKLAS